MNNKEKLVVLDLSEDKNIIIENSIIFQLSPGIVTLKNCNYLKKNFFSEKEFNHFQKEINKEMLNFYNLIKKNSKENFELLEIFNQRNDKTQIYNKIYFFIQIKKFILKNNFKEIIIYTDDQFFADIYKKAKIKNIKLFNYSKKNKNNFYLRYILSSFNFTLKTFILILFMKFFRVKTINKKNNKACLSLYPNFYKQNKDVFYKKKFLKLNFQITDETHLNNSLLRNINTFLKLRRLNNTILVERFINMRSIFFCLFKSFNNIGTIKISNKHIFKINGDDFSLPFKHLFLDSLINFNKFYIYESALKNLFDQSKIIEFNYYLFEYNFGYFLSSIIKKISPKTRLIGHQHGIYSERLMWQNFMKLKKSNQYFPHKIVFRYKVSKKSYLDNFKNIKLKLEKEYKKTSYNKQKKNNSKNFLVFLGLHDCYNIINFLRSFNHKIFFNLKLHPKINFKNLLKLSKNFSFIDKVKNYRFSTIILSSTSTMSYKFYEEKRNFKIAIPYNQIPLNPKILDRLIIKDKQFN